MQLQSLNHLMACFKQKGHFFYFDLNFSGKRLEKADFLWKNEES